MVRRFVGAVVAAGALTVLAVAPAAAEFEFCLADPPVVVDGTTLHVGLYTHDPSLANGGVSGAIGVTIIGLNSDAISTDDAAWSTIHQTNVHIVAAGRRQQAGGSETVEFDAVVPSALPHESFYLKVELPDGSTEMVAASANSVAHLRVDVPVHQ